MFCAVLYSLGNYFFCMLFLSIELLMRCLWFFQRNHALSPSAGMPVLSCPHAPWQRSLVWGLGNGARGWGAPAERGPSGHCLSLQHGRAPGWPPVRLAEGRLRVSGGAGPTPRGRSCIWVGADHRRRHVRGQASCGDSLGV